MGTAREEILNKLKQAVYPEPEKPDFDAPVYFPIETSLDQAFKENLEKVNGSVHLCSSHEELYKELELFLQKFPKDKIVCNEEALKQQLQKYQVEFISAEKLPFDLKVGITSCEFLVAHTGSVMVSSALGSGRQLFAFPEVHVVIAENTQVVDYLEAAYDGVQKKYGKKLPSQVSLITGPSRTADIEKTLVMGAHGPRELHIFINQNKKE